MTSQAPRASQLASVPIARRQRMAATLGLFAGLFVAMGVVATVREAPTLVRVFAGIAFALAVLMALIAWGVLRSVMLDRAAPLPPVARTCDCNCGHQHDVAG